MVAGGPERSARGRSKGRGSEKGVLSVIVTFKTMQEGEKNVVGWVSEGMLEMELGELGGGEFTDVRRR